MNGRRNSVPWLHPWALLLGVFILVATACGGGNTNQVTTDAKSTTTTSTGAPTTTSTAAPAPSTTAAPVAPTVTTKAKAVTTSTAPTTTTTAKKISSEITALAAASLTESFTEIGKAFEAANPDAKVKFSFDSSSTLANQANGGAPADLFASADDANMKKATDTGAAINPKPFTRNRLAILVGKGNPKGIAYLKDFERSDVFWVRCADGVPCGDYAKEALSKANVDTGAHPPKSLETNVKGVVTRVTSGSADAGIVYVTDGKAASANSETIDIPDDVNVVASYPIAVLKQSSHADIAGAFIDFLLSAKGQAILVKYGFLSL